MTFSMGKGSRLGKSMVSWYQYVGTVTIFWHCNYEFLSKYWMRVFHTRIFYEFSYIIISDCIVSIELFMSRSVMSRGVASQTSSELRIESMLTWIGWVVLKSNISEYLWDSEFEILDGILFDNIVVCKMRDYIY